MIHSLAQFILIRFRETALNWILQNNRFDDVKKVLDTVVRWLERIVLYDHGTGKSLSILIDVSNDGEFGFLMKYMSKFDRVPKEKYASAANYARCLSAVV